MMTTTETPQVWIGCLAAYNEGHLHGKWVDATDVDEMHEAAAQIIKTSPATFAEEYFVADYNGFPRQIVHDLGEYPDYEAVANVGRAIEEHGEAFEAWLETMDYGADYADPKIVERFQEEYRGEWDSEKAFSMELCCSELGWAGLEAEQVDQISSYIDWDSVSRELFQHGSYSLVNGYVFESMT